MGTDDLFKKRRAKRKAREAGTKIPKANSYLIVTEGTQTEPNYFNGLKKLIMAKIGGTVDIVPMPQIDVTGQGCSTMSLLDVTDRLVNKATIIYQNIWVVFDKDDFNDFDDAIAEAEKRGYLTDADEPYK